MRKSNKFRFSILEETWNNIGKWVGNCAWGTCATLECPKLAILHLLTTQNPKPLRVEAKKLSRVMMCECHGYTLNRACIACAADLGTPFGRLINRRLTNLLVRCVVDGGHWRLFQHHFSSSDLKKTKKKKEREKRMMEERREGKRAKNSSLPGDESFFGESREKKFLFFR